MIMNEDDENLYPKDPHEFFALTGKVAIVTGGAGGIGRSISLTLATFGADVIIASRTPQKLSLQDQVGKLPGRLRSASADVTIAQQVDALVAETVERFGKIDILVNSHGLNVRMPALEFPIDEWQKVVDVNLKGVFLSSRAVAKVMIARKNGGKIINISSVSGRLSSARGYSAYDASKAGVDALTRTLAYEWAKYKINVNAIAPTWIRTDTSEPILRDPKLYEMSVSRIPLGRTGRPLDIAGTVVFLASKASDFITGQTIYVDGGQTAIDESTR
jgi:gluconate 5-dehydrogenase